MTILSIDRPLLGAFQVALLLSATTAAQQWKQHAAPLPSARFAPMAAAAPEEGQAVLFGGALDPRSPFRDTWIFSGGAWIRVSPATSPAPRHSGAMAYDPVRKRTVMFGGFDASVRRLAETWEWDGSTWQRATPSTSPPARAFHQMAYDPLRQVVVLFGGATSFRNRLNDTWEWDGMNWTRVPTSTNPGVRSGHGMAFSPAHGGVVVHGGARGSAASSIYADTWLFDGTDWRLLQTGPDAPAVTAFDLATDTIRGGVLFFGGATPNGVTDATWRLHPIRGWERFLLNERPSARSDHVVFSLSTGEVLTLAGGAAFGSAAGDSWQFGGRSAAATVFGRGCDPFGDAPRLQPDLDAPAQPGSMASVRANGFDASYGRALLNLSDGRLTTSFDLTRIGRPGCTAWLSPPGSVVTFQAPVLAGQATWVLPVPRDATLVGLEFVGQALATGPSGSIALTNGMTLRIGD